MDLPLELVHYDMVQQGPGVILQKEGENLGPHDLIMDLKALQHKVRQLQQQLAQSIDRMPSEFDARGVPHKIYLQIEGSDSATGEEVTWCHHRIHRSDIAYVRRDLIPSL